MIQSSFEPSQRCKSPRRITSQLLVSFLALSAFCSPSTAIKQVQARVPVPPDVLLPVIPGTPAGPPSNSGTGEMTFKLRHVLHHGTFKYPNMLRRLDVRPNDKVWIESEDGMKIAAPELKASARTRPIKRLQDRSRDTVERNVLMARQQIMQTWSEEMWTMDEIPQPNITDKETVINLAKMAADAYVDIPGGQGEWFDIGAPYNASDDFGWDSDGLRGHIFVDDKNTTVIVGVKGTSMAVFDGPETTGNDKLNDNLLFSCCCARISYWWKTVCDCYSGTAYTCNQTCISDALMDESRYYMAGRQLYYNVTQMYPHIKNIWFVGHSLGGAISSLMGQTFGLPVVAFQAPGEAMAAGRLGLPAPPSNSRNKYANNANGVYHFGHTADPIFMGTCNGPSSGCALAGYAMESVCHSGHECVYDVVRDRKWRSGVGYHRIGVVIREVLEKYDTVPECKIEPDCVDCFNWRFLHGNETLPTTTETKTTVLPTVTTTCKSMGWWGCLDPTTTTKPHTTTEPLTTTTSSKGKTTSPSSTATCSSYGWFGDCLDPTTSTSFSTTTATTTATETTTTCTSYGWFGNCLDEVTTTPTITQTSSITSTTTCKSYGWFGNCLDSTTTAETSTPTSTSTQTCKHRGWFGGCIDATTTTDNVVPEPTGEPWAPHPTQTGRGERPAPNKCSWYRWIIGMCSEEFVPNPDQDL